MVIVDCRHRRLESLPEKVPTGRYGVTNIRLLLDNNDITSVDHRPYTNRIKDLQMSMNYIDVIDQSIVKEFNGVKLNISHQRLLKLPKDMAVLNPTDITFGDNPVICDCDNLWIGNWIRAHRAEYQLYCSVDGKNIWAEQVTRETFGGCATEDNSLLTLIVIICVCFLMVLLLIILSVKFKTDLLLQTRKLWRGARSRSVMFVSMCDDNDDVFYFVKTCLRPAFKQFLTVIIPWYDAPYGENRETFISQQVSNSDVFVILLCDQYLESTQSMSEFDTIWKIFKKDKNKDIIIINWLGLKSRAIKTGRMRSLLRNGYALEFDNQDVRLIERLADKINPDMKVAEPYLTYPHILGGPGRTDKRESFESRGTDSEATFRPPFKPGQAWSGRKRSKQNNSKAYTSTKPEILQHCYASSSGNTRFKRSGFQLSKERFDINFSSVC